ncbi:MAG: permease-like cell division protein FtsX [Bdellovibrionaceae bacterium]|nr:permease-like cell division protein FtsX [Pseudobdellovibrionaceae bacterium]
MRELRHRLFLRLTTWLTLTACFAVLSSALLLALNLSMVMTLWGDDIQVTAYLNQDAGPDRLREIEGILKRDARIGRFEYTSREKALTDFRAQMASYAPDLAADDDLLSLIPSSFQISLAGSAPADRLEDLAHDLKNVAGVEEVRYGQEWLKKYSAVLSALKGSVGLIGGVLLVAGLLVIGNAVRASVEARRNEVEVLEMIGATSWMIRKPFLMEGATLGFLSSLSAVILTFGGFLAVQGVIRDELNFLNLAQHVRYFPLWGVAFAVVGGTVLGAMASYLCIRRLNDGWAAAGGRR